MKARIGGRLIEVDPSKVRGGVAGARRTVAPERVSSSPTPSPSSPPGWPRLDERWNWVYACLLEQEKTAGEVRAWWYEPFSLWLPGKIRYKPDFLVWRTGGERLEVVEIKGWSKNLRDGITRVKVAAGLFPCWDWKLVTREDGEWDVQYLSAWVPPYKGVK